MRPHRLDRLARLTQGAALVGIGLFDAACGKEPKPDYRPVPNATATPTPSELSAQKQNRAATPPAVGSAGAADAGRAPTP
jgi:hypothetical protein